MIYEKVCENCGKPFKTTSYWARFCSVLCRVQFWRKQQKQKASDQPAR